MLPSSFGGPWLALVLGLTLALVAAPAASAGPQNATPPLDISAGDAFAGCAPIGAGINYPDAEVEPWVDVNPLNPQNIVAIYQQDRYSSGAAKGNVSSASFDGGQTWTQVPVPADTVCTGGKYDRATDPWLSFSPNGVLHAMSLVTGADPPAGFGDNGMAYNSSKDGGRTWEPAILLIEEPTRGSSTIRTASLPTRTTRDSSTRSGTGSRTPRPRRTCSPPRTGRAGLQGPDLLHPHDERRRLVGAGAQDLGVRRQQAVARQPDRRAAHRPRRRRAGLLQRVPQRVQPGGLPALAVV